MFPTFILSTSKLGVEWKLSYELDWPSIRRNTIPQLMFRDKTVQKDAIDKLTGVQFLRTLRANMAH